MNIYLYSTSLLQHVSRGQGSDKPEMPYKMMNFVIKMKSLLSMYINYSADTKFIIYVY